MAGSWLSAGGIPGLAWALVCALALGLALGLLGVCSAGRAGRHDGIDQGAGGARGPQGVVQRGGAHVGHAVWGWAAGWWGMGVGGARPCVAAGGGTHQGSALPASEEGRQASHPSSLPCHPALPLTRVPNVGHGLGPALGDRLRLRRRQLIHVRVHRARGLQRQPPLGRQLHHLPPSWWRAWQR